MKIIIDELKFRAIIGVSPKERTEEQGVEISCEIEYNYINSSYLDYDKIANTIVRTIRHKKFRLLEDALNSICNMLKDRYDVIESIRIKIIKPEILPNCKVGVEQFKIF